MSHECKEIQLSKLLDVQLQKYRNVSKQIHYTVATRKNHQCQSSSLNDPLCVSCQLFHFENVTAVSTILLRHTETIMPQFKEILFI